MTRVDACRCWIYLGCGQASHAKRMTCPVLAALRMSWSGEVSRVLLEQIQMRRLVACVMMRMLCWTTWPVCAPHVITSAISKLFRAWTNVGWSHTITA